MENNLRVVERYFELVDIVNDDDKYFDELMSLYSDDIESHSNDGSVSNGKQELIQNTRNFYNWLKGGKSKHFYKITKAENNIVEVDWAVSSKLADGNVLAIQGHNYYTFNEKNKICKLVVQNK